MDNMNKLLGTGAAEHSLCAQPGGLPGSPGAASERPSHTAQGKAATSYYSQVREKSRNACKLGVKQQGIAKGWEWIGSWRMGPPATEAKCWSHRHGDHSDCCMQRQGDGQAGAGQNANQRCRSPPGLPVTRPRSLEIKNSFFHKFTFLNIAAYASLC